MNERTHIERLAVIEAVVLRTETKLDQHIESMSARVSHLERAWAYTKGAFSLLTVLLTGVATYLKVSWK